VNTGLMVSFATESARTYRTSLIDIVLGSAMIASFLLNAAYAAGSDTRKF
jgi:hypothetical protein